MSSPTPTRHTTGFPRGLLQLQTARKTQNSSSSPSSLAARRSILERGAASIPPPPSFGGSSSKKRASVYVHSPIFQVLSLSLSLLSRGLLASVIDRTVISVCELVMEVLHRISFNALMQSTGEASGRIFIMDC